MRIKKYMELVKFGIFGAEPSASANTVHVGKNGTQF
jgi:hypothetical protein